MNIRELQRELLKIVLNIVIGSDDKTIETMLERALKIISDKDFRKHINDDIYGYTILDIIDKCSKGVGRDCTEKKWLAEIEKAIKDAGGKTSQQLGRKQNVKGLQSISGGDSYHLVRTILENLVRETEQLGDAIKVSNKASIESPNNEINHEINVKKEKNYRWSNVFAWLYLNTIGRILPKRWNKWAENILYYDKATESNEIHTDGFKTVDESAEIGPEIAEKKSQSGVIGKDGDVQTTFQDTAVQTDGLTTVDESIQSEVISKDEGIQIEEEDCFNNEVNNGFIDDTYFDMEGVSTEEDEVLSEQLENISQELELTCLQNVSLKEANKDLESKLEKKSKEILKLNKELIECSIEFANKTERLSVEVEEKDGKISSLTRLNEGLGEELQETRGKLAGQERLVGQLQADIKKLQGEKRDQLTEMDSLKGSLSIVVEQLEQQQLLNNQERQKLEEELKDVNEKLQGIEKTKGLQEQTKARRNPLQGNNLEHFLSDKNKELKKSFPEFKGKNFLLNLFREIVKFVSNKQDDKIQGSELLNLFKNNLKNLTREIIEDMVQEVVTSNINYYKIGKNIDKELLDGTMCKGKLKAKLSPSVERCTKKLGLDVKDAITITDSIIDKLYDKENNEESPSALLEKIVVEELTEARMEIFLEKVKEINSVPNNVPSSFMSHTNNTAHVLSLSNGVGQR
ncbi:hypothetical protein [Wolbachia endosymbiont of Cantharis cryptica]|uniref:hypothetical protein n=1 Tax=Wolbachia endosymbiont of Cantharis cryptica TaxID=3066132 RepID=UPI00376F22A5